MQSKPIGGKSERGDWNAVYEMKSTLYGDRSTIRQVLTFLILLGIVIMCGTAGYVWIEGMVWLQALYFTVITISTVGYNLPESISQNGLIFTIVLILVGVSIVFYGITNVAAVLIEGKVRGLFKARRSKKMIAEMNNHTIIIGGGVTGRYILTELIHTDESFVVVDLDEEAINNLKTYLKSDFLHIIGDATEETILNECGVMRAKSLITALPTDSLNVFVVLSARTLNPDLFIISKASSHEAIKKLKYAGANEVVAVHEISGKRMARLATHPEAVNFMEVMLFNKAEYRIDEIKVEEDAWFCGKSLMKLKLPQEYGLMVVAIQRGLEIMFSPTGAAQLLPEDRLVVLGKRSAIGQFLSAERISESSRETEHLKKKESTGLS